MVIGTVSWSLQDMVRLDTVGKQSGYARIPHMPSGTSSACICYGGGGGRGHDTQLAHGCDQVIALTTAIGVLKGTNNEAFAVGLVFSLVVRAGLFRQHCLLQAW